MTPQRILKSPEAGVEGVPTLEETITIPLAELEALRASAEQASASEASAAEARERLRLVERRFDDELSERSRKAEEWERACKGALKEKELAAALSGRSLVPGAAPQLVKLWREELEVIDDGGRLRVSTRDGRNVSDAVGAWLSDAEYAHFSRPTSRGGTAPPGDARSKAPGPPPSPRPEPGRSRPQPMARGHSGRPLAGRGADRARPTAVLIPL